MRNTDGVGKLNLTLVSDASGHDVLCNVAGCIRCGAVNLGGVFTGEGAATVRGIAAVGVNDDLTSGEARVCGRATLDKSARGIDEQAVSDHVHIRPIGQQFVEDRLDDVFLQGFDQILRGNTFLMLGRDDDGVNPYRVAPSSYSTVTCVFPSGRM